MHKDAYLHIKYRYNILKQVLLKEKEKKNIKKKTPKHNGKNGSLQGLNPKTVVANLRYY